MYSRSARCHLLPKSPANLLPRRQAACSACLDASRGRYGGAAGTAAGPAASQARDLAVRAAHPPFRACLRLPICVLTVCRGVLPGAARKFAGEDGILDMFALRQLRHVAHLVVRRRRVSPLHWRPGALRKRGIQRAGSLKEIGVELLQRRRNTQAHGRVASKVLLGSVVREA